MVNHICNTCLKQFKRRIDLVYHIEKKKTPCQPIIQENYQDPPEAHQDPPETHQVPPEKHQDPPDSEEELKKNLNKDLANQQQIQKIIHSCSYCGLVFTRQDTLKRHMDKRCKVKILDNEQKEKTFELLIKQNHEKDKEIKEIKKELDEIKKQMEKQLNKVQTQNINKGNITNNNIIIPQSRLTDFGSEDYEKINIKKILNSIKGSGVHSIINCLNDIHNNDDTPQYKNVFITDKSRDKGMVYEHGQWKVKPIKFIVGEIITHIERYVRVIEKRIKQGKYKDIIDPDDPDKKKKLNIKDLKEKIESRLKKYILRYYGDDEETTPKDSKKFYDMVLKYISNHLFDIKDTVYRHYEMVLEDINKDPEDNLDPDIQVIKEEKINIIENLDKLKDIMNKQPNNKDILKTDNESENEEDEESEESDVSDDEEKTVVTKSKEPPTYVLKTITLASGLQKKVWMDVNANVDDYYNF